MCVLEDTISEVISVPYVLFGLFSPKWHIAKEEWDSLKVRGDILFIVTSPAPGIVHDTLVRKCFSKYPMI